MFCPHYLLLKDFIDTTSDKASSILHYVVDDFNNVIFNDSPEERAIARVGRYLNQQLLKGNHCRQTIKAKIKILM